MDASTTYEDVKNLVLSYEVSTTNWSAARVQQELGLLSPPKSSTSMEVDQEGSVSQIKGQDKGKGKGKGKDKGKVKVERVIRVSQRIPPALRVKPKLSPKLLPMPNAITATRRDTTRGIAESIRPIWHRARCAPSLRTMRLEDRTKGRRLPKRPPKRL